MMKRVVLTVGNSMMGDDGAGPLLAQMLKQNPIEEWDVIEGGTVPENIIHQVRESSSDRILVVDASDMDLPAGSTRLIKDDLLEDPFLMTTHSLPLTFLLEALREFVPQVDLLGIQPELVAFGYPMSKKVRDAVQQVYQRLESGNLSWEVLFPPEPV